FAGTESSDEIKRVGQFEAPDRSVARNVARLVADVFDDQIALGAELFSLGGFELRGRLRGISLAHHEKCPAPVAGALEIFRRPLALAFGAAGKARLARILGLQ